MAEFVLIRSVNMLHKKQEEAPKTQDCPYCLMSIPINATRCGHCTADLKKT